MGPGLEVCDPVTQSVRPPAMMAAHGTSPVNKQKAQVTIPALADAAQCRLTTGRMLERHQPEPCRKVSPLGKRGAVADGRHEGRCRQWHDAGHLCQPTTGLVLTSERGDLLIDVTNGFVETATFFAQPQ